MCCLTCYPSFLSLPSSHLDSTLSHLHTKRTILSLMLLPFYLRICALYHFSPLSLVTTGVDNSFFPPPSISTSAAKGRCLQSTDVHQPTPPSICLVSRGTDSGDVGKSRFLEDRWQLYDIRNMSDLVCCRCFI